LATASGYNGGNDRNEHRARIEHHRAPRPEDFLDFQFGTMIDDR
jgi:hypothetical protein